MEKRQAAPWIHSVSAFGGAIISTTVTHPLDLVKARFQVQHVNKQLGGKIVYRSTLQAFGLIFKTEGVAGLYRGVIPNLCGNGVAWATYMLFYSSLKNWVSTEEKEPPTSLKSLGLAALAGAGSSVLTNPIWLVKLRFQSQPHDAPDKYLHIRDAVKTIYREEGIRGFWRGIGPALLGTSHGAVQMVAYEKLRSMAWARIENMTPVHYLWLGIASKVVASVTTFPYQLIKTRMQVRDAHFHRHSSMRETITSVWKQEGIKGFYRGVVPATFRTIPHAALMFSSYEMIRSWLSATEL